MSPSRRAAGALAVLALAAGPALAGCASADAGAGRAANFVAGDGSVRVLAESERPAPIALSGRTLEGGTLDVASLRGKVVVLNVWGSWCPPCRKEAPDLQAAATALEDRGVAFVGLNVNDRDPVPALAYQRTFKIRYPSLVDDGGRSLLALRGAVAPNAIPSTLVLDRQGRIAARISGATTRATLVGIVEDVLGRPS
jgi:thiol-disulfide isomerase/thioredoxin